MMHWCGQLDCLSQYASRVSVAVRTLTASSKGEIGIDIGQDKPDVCGVPLCTHAHASAGGYLARAVGWMSRVSSDTHESMGTKTEKYGWK